MKTIIAAALLVLASQARAQIAVDPDKMAEVKKQMEQQKALAPAAVDLKAIDELAQRLDKDGEDGTADNLEAKIFTHAGQPDKKGSFENRRMTLFERELPPPSYTDPKTGITISNTVMRKALIQLQGETKKYTVLSSGEAQIEAWTFVVSMDGRLMEVQKGVYIGKRHGADGVDVDPKRSRELKMKPGEPDVLKRWKSLSDEFRKYGNTIQI